MAVLPGRTSFQSATIRCVHEALHQASRQSTRLYATDAFVALTMRMRIRTTWLETMALSSLLAASSTRAPSVPSDRSDR